MQTPEGNDISTIKNNAIASPALYSDVLGYVYSSYSTSITRTVQKMLMRRVLSDIYRITQDKFQYHGVEISMSFRVFTLYNSY